jgi:creatinine amidohydrolase
VSDEAPPPNLQLELLTWREIKAAIAAGYTTVILPCGAIEQHGPHLPLFVDAEHAERLAVEVASRLGRTLVAPTIRIGYSPHHLAFAGTLSLSRSTFAAVYRDCCVSLARHGFRKILCFSAHGGNFAPLREMQPDLARAVAPDCRVEVFSDFDRFLETWRDVVEKRTGKGSFVGGHSDIAETSVLAAMHPDLVRWDRLEPGLTGGLNSSVVQDALARGFDAVTPNGVLGDPTGANADLGRECIAAMADMLADYFRGV